MKHTPAPWVATQTATGRWKVYDGQVALPVADIDPRRTPEETAANAALIAAAPELLRQLEAIAEQLPIVPPNVRLAIARAKGEPRQ